MAQGGSKWHPLHAALIFGELDKAKQVLKDSGNDPKLLSERNNKGWACLHFAAHSGHPHQVRRYKYPLMLAIVGFVYFNG